MNRCCLLGMLLTLTIALACGSLWAQSTEPAGIQLEFTEETTTGANPVWALKNYALEQSKDKRPYVSLKAYRSSLKRGVSVEGDATTIFTGPDGYYTLEVEYSDSSSGRTRMALRVDGKEQAKWEGDNLFSEVAVRKVVPHVQLKKGSAIQIWGRTGSLDFAPLLGLKVLPGTPKPAPPAEGVSAIVYSTNLIPATERVACTDPNEMIPLQTRTWPDAGVPADLSAAPVYLFKASKGQKFEANVGNPDRASERSYVWSIKKWPEAESGAEQNGILAVPPTLSGRVAFVAPEDGVYALRVGGVVTGITHGLTQPLSDNLRQIHFLVPSGTKGFLIKGPVKTRSASSVIVRDGAGIILWQGEVAPKKVEYVVVPPQKDGQVWSIASNSPRGVSLEGVPQYGALTPADLLAPIEALPATPIVQNAKVPVAKPKPLAATANMAGQPPVTLVRAGQPNCVIVTSKALDEARLLQRVLQQISGALIPVVDSIPEKGAAIVLGTEADFPNLPLPDDFGQLNREGLFIRTRPDRLFIIGKSAAAMEPAVYTFLRQLGCRWYLGNEQWEILPNTRDIVVAQDHVTQPDFQLRSISEGTSTADGVPEMQLWARQNRLGGSMRGAIYHSYETFVSKKLFEQHPEYFSMRDTNKDGIGDTRTEGQPCTTHPDVINLFIQGAIAALEKNPETDLLPVSPNDGTISMCRCERCRAVGSYSDCAWTIAHQVAEAVRAKFPGRKVWIGFYAYGEVSRPPTLNVPADPDIAVQIATSYNKVSIDRMLATWPKYVGAIGIREYFVIPQWGANNPGRGITLEKARRVIPKYKSSHSIMLNAEACPAWGGAGLGMYAGAQLMWDSTQDVDALANEFYSDCFGAAAKPMKSYFDRWERERFEPRTAKAALIDLREALRLADTADARRRVGLYALFLHSLQIADDWQALQEPAEAAKRDQFIEESGTFRWRSRNIGMLRRLGSGEADYSGLPYFTHEEIVALVERDLKTLADVELGELRTQFGGSLMSVPPEAIGNQRGGDDWVTFEQGVWNAISRKDQPIVVEVSGNGGTVEAQCMLLSGQAPTETKSLTLTDDKGRIEFNVPAGEACRIRVTAQKVRYRITGAAAWAMFVPKEKNKSWSRLSFDAPESATFYFYVPAGAEAIVVGVTGRSKPTAVASFCDNGGTPIHEEKADPKSGRFQMSPQLVHVPPGKDNQVWSIKVNGPVTEGRLFLKGVPPYVQVDPAKLLVPRDGVEMEEDDGQ